MIVELLRVECACGLMLPGTFDNHHAAIVAAEAAGWLMQSESIGGDQCPRCLGNPDAFAIIEELATFDGAAGYSEGMRSDLDELIDQRDKARAELREGIERWKSWREECIADYEQAVWERDEARSEAARFFRERDSALADLRQIRGMIASFCDGRDLRREDITSAVQLYIDHLAGQIAGRDRKLESALRIADRTEKERDEAHAELEKVTQNGLRVCRDRDQLRSELAATNEVVKAQDALMVAQKRRLEWERDEAISRGVELWEYAAHITGHFDSALALAGLEQDWHQEASGFLADVCGALRSPHALTGQEIREAVERAVRERDEARSELDALKARFDGLSKQAERWRQLRMDAVGGMAGWRKEAIESRKKLDALQRGPWVECECGALKVATFSCWACGESSGDVSLMHLSIAALESERNKAIANAQESRKELMAALAELAELRAIKRTDKGWCDTEPCPALLDALTQRDEALRERDAFIGATPVRAAPFLEANDRT